MNRIVCLLVLGLVLSALVGCGPNKGSEAGKVPTSPAGGGPMK